VRYKFFKDENMLRRPSINNLKGSWKMMDLQSWFFSIDDKATTRTAFALVALF